MVPVIMHLETYEALHRLIPNDDAWYRAANRLSSVTEAAVIAASEDPKYGSYNNAEAEYRKVFGSV